MVNPLRLEESKIVKLSCEPCENKVAGYHSYDTDEDRLGAVFVIIAGFIGEGSKSAQNIVNRIRSDEKLCITLWFEEDEDRRAGPLRLSEKLQKRMRVETIEVIEDALRVGEARGLWVEVSGGVWRIPKPRDFILMYEPSQADYVEASKVVQYVLCVYPDITEKEVHERINGIMHECKISDGAIACLGSEGSTSRCSRYAVANLLAYMRDKLEIVSCRGNGRCTRWDIVKQ